MTVKYKQPLTIDGQINHIADTKRVVFNMISIDQSKEILRKYG